MGDIHLLAVDIDGTLLDSHGRLPEANRQAVAAARARGVAIALVTGRSFHFARPVAEALGVPSTLIVNNGAAVKETSGRTLMRHLLPRELARHIIEAAEAFHDSVALVFDREPGSDELHQIVFEHMDWNHPHRRGYYEKNQAFISRTAPLVSALGEDPLQVMFNGSVGRMRALARYLRQLPRADELSVAATEYEPRDFSLVDVNRAGCSKGSTLAAWAAARGVPAEQVMAVGDNLNDVEMLRFAGTSVVMANASDDLKELGFHVTGNHDEGGLAAAIRRFVLNRA